jgi:methyltransferase OMS1
MCSIEDPVAALREMRRVCKPGGKILLLEHGRSTYFTWLNSYLDAHVDAHASKWGCWWNKDLLSLIDSSGLVVESTFTWHFGTTRVVVASPGPKAQSV